MRIRLYTEIEVDESTLPADAIRNIPYPIQKYFSAELKRVVRMIPGVKDSETVYLPPMLKGDRS